MRPEIELLLWRWSTTVQVISAVMIAVFLVAIGRSTRRVEARPWAWAWIANLGALLVTVTYWFLGDSLPEAVHLLLRSGYFLGKTAFLVLLVLGARAFAQAVPQPWSEERRLALPVIAYSVLAGAFLTSIPSIGVMQASVTALGCGIGATILLRSGTPGALALSLGFAFRAVLGLVEAVAYGIQATGGAAGTSRELNLFLASHSSLDTGAEWVIALGCVLTLYRHIQLELQQTNAELLRAHETLQGLVDMDALTGLANRRALPGMLRKAYGAGGTLLFFDLDGFKELNDAYGHAAGDAALARFARTLRSGFRPDDDVVRYGGDEFVVVAYGAEPDGVLERAAAVRERLARAEGQVPPVRFSVGHARIAPGDDAQAALRAADEAMYAVKSGRGEGATPEVATPPSGLPSG